MSRRRALWMPLIAISAAALLLWGCGGAKRPASPEPVSLTIHIPCVISGPMQKVTRAYETAHPGVEITLQTYKPQEKLPQAAGPTALITVGKTEMDSFARAGAVSPTGVRTFATNAFSLVVIAPTQGAPELKQVSDLTRPSVKRIFLEDPSRSSLGARAAQAFREMELWEEIQRKTIAPKPGAMVLADLLAGKADAAVVFEDCLLEGGSPPKTIRIIGELTLKSYPPLLYQVAAARTTSGQGSAQAFVDFLLGKEGQQSLRKAKLRPVR